MPARYEILESAHLKHVVIEGRTSFEELKRTFLAYAHDPAFSPDLRILADLRGMTDALAGLWEIRKLKALYQYAYHDAVGVVDVVIVTGTGVAFRAARAFQLMMRDRKPLAIRIAKSMAEAQSMLQLGDDVMAQMARGGQSSKIFTLPNR